MNTWPKYWNS